MHEGRNAEINAEMQKKMHKMQINAHKCKQKK